MINVCVQQLSLFGLSEVIQNYSQLKTLVKCTFKNLYDTLLYSIVYTGNLHNQCLV